MNFRRFISFEKMITPVIIKIIFWVGLIISAGTGIGVFLTMFVTGISNGGFGPIIGGFFLGILGALLITFLGALATRIYAELLIVVFQINETLTGIKELLKEK